MRTATIISSDSHVVEPPELWVERIEPAFRARAPRLIEGADGDIYWCEGIELNPVSSFSAVGQGPEAFRGKARFHEAVRPGAYDPHARLADMELDGLAAEVLYPTVALRMFAMPDTPLRQAVFRAYNDWIADFCQTYPDKFVGIGMVDTETVEDAVAELKRIATLGLGGAMISISPDTALYWEPAFDPFWSTAVETGLPISLHTGTNRTAQPALATLTVGDFCTHSATVQRTLANLVFGGVFDRHPQLRVLSVENGAGWAPYLMQSMDNSFHTGGQRGLPGSREGLLPSEYFRRNVRLTFMRDRLAICSREVIGVECLLWASDYPHRESTFPHSRAVLDEMMGDIPAEDRAAISGGNTARLYGLA